MGSAEQAVVCVFCGASPGTSPSYMEAARALGRTFAEHNIKLVYGGGTSGIMGEVAKTLVSLRGPESAHGVIPRSLLRTERNYDATTAAAVAAEPEVAKLIDEAQFGSTTVVPDMHTRKQTMKELVLRGGPGSGFVALHGGWGTLEELAEMTTWNQLGIHELPVVLLNVDGYWDGLLQWVRNAVGSGFITPANAGIMVEARSSEEAVEKLRSYVKSEGRFKLSWDKA